MRNLGGTLGALVALAAVAFLGPPTRAQTGLPADVAASIRGAAEASRQLAARETAISAGLDNPQLAETTARKARRRADAALTSAVLAIIAANKAQADAVVEAAVAQAPESRDSIVAGVAAAFPGLVGGDGAPAVPMATAMPAPIAPPVAPIGRAAPPQAPVEEPGPSVQEEIVDPLEPINRIVFAVNDTLDTLVFRPVAVIYGILVPEVAKRSVRNFFDNLGAPVRFANDLLQFTFKDAAVTGGRFLVNSTVGVLGLFEIAEDLGLEPHHADFGQTLHSYGVGQGLYVMLPIFGPSTARDAAGSVVDVFFQPTTYFLDPVWRLSLTVGEGLARRETLIVALDDLRASSIDFYAALRAAYYQDRAVELSKGRADTAATIDVLFEDFE